MRENWAGGLYLQRGFYAHHLQAYFEKFPTDQIRVYLFEDLSQRPDELFADLFSYIGVDPTFQPNISRTLNVSGVLRNPILRWIWTGTHSAQALVRPFLPKRVRQSISNIFTGLEKETVEFSPELRHHLTEIYRADILNLQQMLKRDLSSWLET